MYDTILVPTDGSDHAVRAAEHGSALSEKFDATVHVLHVVDTQSGAGPFDVGGIRDEVIGRLEEEGEGAIEASEAVFDGSDPLRTGIVRGQPSETILEYATDHEVDILVMGTQGRTGLERYLMGSVTERVIRAAELPVLTVRATDQRHFDGDYDEILVPTDGSRSAGAAVEHGIAIADHFDARLHAVNVVDIGEFAATGNFTPPAELLERYRSQGASATDRIATRARDAGVEAVTAVCEGFPAEELIGYRKDNDIDLIAMGTAGRTGLRRYLIGSTTERIIRRAEVPVVAVNASNQPDQ